MLYLAAPTLSCNGGSGVRIAGPGRVTMSGLGVDMSREEFLADGWTPSPQMPANLKKDNLYATFDKEGDLIELWGAELMLDGKVVALNAGIHSPVAAVHSPVPMCAALLLTLSILSTTG